MRGIDGDVTEGPSRILGVDSARAVAIVGMVAIHIGPQEMSDGGLLGAAYRSAHGRASVLFVVLAGIGVSLLAGDGGPARLERTGNQLLWRAAVLLPIGLALQALPINVAVILQYYAVYFLVALVAVRWPDRWLWIGAGASALVGPALIVWLHGIAPDLFRPDVPHWTDIDRIVRDIFVTGYYPAIVWTAPLLVGIRIGRWDLRSPTVTRWLMIGGAATAAVGFLAADGLTAVLGSAISDSDWRTLALLEPHNEMPLWIASSTGLAVTVLGVCLAAARRLPRMGWPLVAFGQLAFTTYVLHLIVLAIVPEWLIRTDFGPAWISLLRFTLVAAVLATAWRAIAPRGPFEYVLRAPSTTQRPSSDPEAVDERTGRQVL